MEIIKWSEKYSLGIDEIDNDHKELIKLLETLQESYDTCLDKETTLEMFNKLEDYAAKHFSLEESIMDDLKYPFKSGHVRDHTYFATMVKKWRNDEKIECKSQKLSQFLTEWLFEHILHHDMKLRDHIKQENHKTDE
ncbi:MAG: bacteriohemerythrin [Spirochaetes bacterium]|jgi:hemerythrin|nr:bacteriohemerythrin [Spirochaetota bacterium]